MILINLLPHREEKRRQRKQAFFVGLAAAALVGAAVVGVWYFVLQQMTAAQQARNQFLRAEITRLELQIKDIATLRAEIEALKARQKAVEDLQTDRNTPVRMLDELVKLAPEGVYLTSVKQTANLVSVTGIAQTNERVSELMRNLVQGARWLEFDQLIESKAVTMTAAGSKEQRRLFDFSLRVRIKQPPAPAAAAAPAASAPAAKSS